MKRKLCWRENDHSRTFKTLKDKGATLYLANTHCVAFNIRSNKFHIQDCNISRNWRLFSVYPVTVSKSKLQLVPSVCPTARKPLWSLRYTHSPKYAVTCWSSQKWVSQMYLKLYSSFPTENYYNRPPENFHFPIFLQPTCLYLCSSKKEKI